jgi:hypothetical protein
MHFYGRNIAGTDSQMYYAYVRSWIIDSDLDFRNEFVSLTPYPEQLPSLKETRTGHVANKCLVGFSLFSLPFFVLAHLLSLGFSVFNASLFRPDGYSLLYDLLVSLGHVAYGIAGIFLSYKFLRGYFEQKWVLTAITAVWFSTCLIYYGAFFPLMAHVPGFFAVSALYYLCGTLRHQSRWYIFLLIGVLSGLLIVLRFSNTVMLLFPAYVFWNLLLRHEARKDKPKWFGKIFLSLCSFGAMIALQLIVWKIIYGSYFVYSYGSERLIFNHPHILEVLFSSNHGLFFWFPITLISLAGLIFAVFKERKTEISLFALSMSLLIYLNASWHSWWFGNAFGSRAFSEAGLIFSFGLAYFLKFGVKRFSWALIICGIFMVWNVYMLGLYYLNYLPRCGVFPLKLLFPFLS